MPLHTILPLCLKYGNIRITLFWTPLLQDKQQHTAVRMPKQLLNLDLERDNLQQKWGFTIQGGADLALTAKVASVKVRGVMPSNTIIPHLSPRSRSPRHRSRCSSRCRDGAGSRSGGARWRGIQRVFCHLWAELLVTGHIRTHYQITWAALSDSGQVCVTPTGVTGN